MMWLVGILAAFNIALIATIWLGPSLKPPPGHRREGRFEHELKFTADQRERLNEMKHGQHQKIDSLKRLAGQIREFYFIQLKETKPEATLLDSLSGQLGYFHQLIEKQTFSYFSEMRTMLTTSQLPVFDDMVGDIVKSLPEQPRQHGEPPHPPHGGQGRPENEFDPPAPADGPGDGMQPKNRLDN
ncbi:MAG: hypothetical protein H7257_09010 [Taibaiella sp.]|nr:hypothetical protein [Taibaiella sp.]